MTMWAFGQDLGQIAVAFVGDDDRRSGFGDEEVRAGNADVGGEKLRPQHLARFGEQLLGLGETAIGRQIAMRLAEFLLDVLRGKVDRRRDDVRRRFAAQLDDVFAEVGFDRFDLRRLESVVEADLFGDHRLALGDALRAHRLAEADDDLARFLGVLGVVHFAAALAHLALVGLEIEVEMGERMVLDRAGAVPQRVELGKPGDRGRPAPDEIA